MKKGIEIGLIYAGTIIGAGFASGAELYGFFGKFGYMGLWGMAAAFLLYLFLGCAVFYIVGGCKGKTAAGALGRGIIPQTAIFLNYIFVFVLLVSMTAASASLTSELLTFSPFYGSLLFCLFLYLCVTKRKEIFANTGATLTIILTACGIYTGLLLCPVYKLTPVFCPQLLPSAAAFALMYVSYNILSLITVMFPFKNYLKCAKIRITAAVTGSLVMFILGVCLLPPLVLYCNISANSALPLPVMVRANCGGITFGIYTAAVFAAVFTTAAGSLYGLSSAVGKSPLCPLLFLILGYFCSFLGFNKIIVQIYPIFGILGLLNIALIMYNYVKSKMNKYT